MDAPGALDELFAAPLDGFVEARARLVAALGAEGRKDDAQRLKKARRPSPSAWATNQVVRRARAEVDGFLAASARLRHDQAAMLAGRTDRAPYQAAAEALRQATSALGDAARRVLVELGRGDDRRLVERVVANVRAGALTDEARSALLDAQLVADLDGGHEIFGGLFAEGGAGAAAVATPSAPEPATPPAPSAPRAPTARELEARRREEERARQLEAARREEAAARAVAATAAAAAGHARDARDEARKRLDEAEAELTRAEREAASAAAGAERATRHRESFEV